MKNKLLALAVALVLTLFAVSAYASGNKADRVTISFASEKESIKPLTNASLVIDTSTSDEPYADIVFQYNGKDLITLRLWQSPDGRNVYAASNLLGGSVFSAEKEDAVNLVSAVFSGSSLARAASDKRLSNLLIKSVLRHEAFSPDLLSLLGVSDAAAFNTVPIFDAAKQILHDKNDRAAVSDFNEEISFSTDDLNLAPLITGSASFQTTITKKVSVPLDSNEFSAMIDVISKSYNNVIGRLNNDTLDILRQFWENASDKNHNLNIYFDDGNNIIVVELENADVKTDGKADNVIVVKTENKSGDTEFCRLSWSNTAAKGGVFSPNSYNIIGIRKTDQKNNGQLICVNTDDKGVSFASSSFRKTDPQSGEIHSGLKYIRQKNGSSSSGALELVYQAKKGFELSVYKDGSAILRIIGKFETTDATPNPDTSKTVSIS